MNNYRSSNYSSFSRYGRSQRNPYVRQSDISEKENSLSASDISCNDYGESNMNDCSKKSNNSCSKSMNCSTDCNVYPQQKDCPKNNINNDKLNGLPLAMAYIPWQTWSKPLSAKEGMLNGSIFTDLILPFTGNCHFGNVNPRGGRR